MANPRQSKKRRSSNPKQTQRTKQKHKKVHVLGNKIIAENWNKKETLDQNYRRMGLAARPLTIYTSGGVEKIPNAEQVVEHGVKNIKSRRSEGKIKRNPDGTTSVIYPESDDEADLPRVPTTQEETAVVKELSQIAAQPHIPNVRRTTTIEGQWLQKLVDTYGEDYDRMMWDKDLNPMQHTSTQLKRKIKKWKESASTS